MKSLKLNIIFTSLIIWFIWSSCFWLEWKRDYGDLNADFPYAGKKTSDMLECSWSTDLWNCISIKEDETKWWNDTIIRRLLSVFGLKSDKNNDLKFIDYTKAILNMALWLLAFIALIMSIYTFYMMIFSDNDKGIEKAKKNLIWIFIALWVIWLARLIVSLMFWRYQRFRKDQEKIIPTMEPWIVQDIN